MRVRLRATGGGPPASPSAARRRPEPSILAQCHIVPDAARGDRERGVGERLRGERQRRNLSQEALAEALGATVRSVRRWESGRALPQPHYRAAYCRVLGMAADELFGRPARPPEPPPQAAPPPLPARNPFFTGRDDVLAELAGTLRASHAVALCGIGGVGKTQVAVEYAHRFRDQRGDVLWLSADGSGDVAASVAALAGALALPEASDANQAAVAAAVRRWLAGSAGWLLVLDNLVDTAVLADWLPAAGRGQVLVTCRHQATGSLAHAVRLEPMTPAESVDLLLRRAKLLPPGAGAAATSAPIRRGVEEIAEAMAGLPLALDQAAAYLEETGATPAQYLALFRRRRLALLQRRGLSAVDHPESIATTILLSFERLRQANPEAASLLSLCAFLHPNDIAEDLFGTATDRFDERLAQTVGDPYLLAEAMASLRSFSLVQRNAESRTFSVHRLVQDVLREGLPAEERRDAAERAVAFVAGAFAQVDGVATWAQRHRLFSHALATTAVAMERELATAEAAELLYRTGSYLRTVGQAAEALPLLTRALAVAERVHGPQHAEVATCLNALGSLHQDMGQYERAESLLERALTMWERSPEPDDRALALALNDLGTLYVRQGRYREGEAAHRRVLAILERQPDRDDPQIGVTLNNLGGQAHMAGLYADAEDYFQRALAFRRRVLGPEHPTVATVLANLGRMLAHDMDRPDEAMPLLVESERIFRLAFGADHWGMSKTLLGQALVMHRKGDLDRADELLHQALALLGRTLGEEHPRVAQALSGLARLRDDQCRYEEAEALHERAIAIQERTLGGRHPDLAASLHNLARHHALLGRRDLALATYERAYEIRRAVLGLDHPDTARTGRALKATRRASGRAD
jgi:tetratricopeptide (TPR) repeat protein/transcriptional regulator with XRE-family HTH domain